MTVIMLANTQQLLNIDLCRSISKSNKFRSEHQSLTTDNCIIFRDALYSDVTRWFPMTRNLHSQDVAKQRVVARKRNIKRVCSTSSLKP